MKNHILHSPEFELNGIIIPEFDLKSGKLIRICLPNNDSIGNDLVHRFRFDLLKYFERKGLKLKWTKEYSERGIRRFLRSLTVEEYLNKQLNNDIKKAKRISEYLELYLEEKVKNLLIGKRKAMALICDFDKHDALIFDYFGVGANEFDYLEGLLYAELRKGKSAIALDRLEFQIKEEVNDTVERIMIDISNKVYKI
ncbi:hypothetical protein U1E44_04195 [Arenibacter sp. GZD96]|uniref:hypothetical protein n=1 Tax=Aurantibrevibacter litoralis TaxID=3106030 RepID=UPI002AFEBF11|nr:hypothetical protein [Arenibacter sp. GZD-96]MEA1785282.1 hypothetical protein [Arenibacter sp. GZD-96]